MRYRLMASYLGVPYHAGLGPDGTEATLFSPAPPPDELGFTEAGGQWRKQVSLKDLGALWRFRLVGEYRGEPCLVLDDLGDRLHLVYLGRDSARARQLGYWEIDREVFEVVTARTDVDGLTEERVEFPLASAGFGPGTAPGTGPARAAPRGPGVIERTSPLRVMRRPEPAPSQQAPSQQAPSQLAPSQQAPPQQAPPPEYGEGARTSSTPDQVAAWHGSPGPWAGPEPEASPPPGRRPGRRDRIPESVFSDLLSLAAIPQSAYAVDEEVPGAMCLVKADGGFEVFTRTADARLDVRFFEDEEAAYFYLFGVLAAEAVRSGRLRPSQVNGHASGSRGPGLPAASRENVSKYLRSRNLPKSTCTPAMVIKPTGLTVPRSPSSPVGLINHPPHLAFRVSRINPFSLLGKRLLLSPG
jgi:hypothetical protein